MMSALISIMVTELAIMAASRPLHGLGRTQGGVTGGVTFCRCTGAVSVPFPNHHASTRAHKRQAINASHRPKMNGTYNIGLEWLIFASLARD